MAEEIVPALYIVPTPIGNLEDITYRSVKILKECDIIACEDTRHTGRLLVNFNINKPMISYHEHNEEKKLEYILSQILTGKSVALVSDAGTPLISDPGYPLVNHCWQNDVKVISLPGPSAFITALAGSGFPNHEFIFKGFIPSTKGRKRFVENMLKEERTVIAYESPRKLKKLILLMNELKEEDFRICLARELTKKFEEYIFGNISEIAENVNNITFKGEFVVLLDLNPKK